MKNVQLANSKISLEISPLGAEIQSLKKDGNDFQYIWNDTTGKYWKRHAPILFPIIGRLNDDTFLSDNQEFHMTQHGFLRDRELKIVDQDKQHVTFEDSFDDDTLKKYPFKYKVIIKYQLIDDQVDVSAQISNQGQSSMYFSLGFHPGFHLNEKLEKYHLSFDPDQSELTNLDVEPAPFLSGEDKKIQLDNGQFQLSHQLLDDGLMVFSMNGINQVSLSEEQQGEILSLDVSEFPYLAIWSPEKKNAPFVCIEPFNGLPDVVGKPREMKDKKGVNQIAPEQIETFEWKLKI